MKKTANTKSKQATKSKATAVAEICRAKDEPALPKLAYSLRETAKIIGVSYITAFRLTKRGLLKSSSALRTKIIPHTEIERFLRETTE